MRLTTSAGGLTCGAAVADCTPEVGSAPPARRSPQRTLRHGCALAWLRLPAADLQHGHGQAGTLQAAGPAHRCACPAACRAGSGTVCALWRLHSLHLQPGMPSLRLRAPCTAACGLLPGEQVLAVLGQACTCGLACPPVGLRGPLQGRTARAAPVRLGQSHRAMLLSCAHAFLLVLGAVTGCLVRPS